MNPILRKLVQSLVGSILWEPSLPHLFKNLTFLVQTTLGVGLPVAEHFNATLRPRFTTYRPSDGSAVILGGTKKFSL